MNWNQLLGASGLFGVTVCGVCVAKTLANAHREGSVSGKSYISEAQCQGQCDGNPPYPYYNRAAFETPDMQELKLKQVHVYFRHGARLPLHTVAGLKEINYEKDLILRHPPVMNFKVNVRVGPDNKDRDTDDTLETHYKKSPLKGGGYAGNLTTVGQSQMYNLGLRLRTAYCHTHKLLNINYTTKDVFIQSSNVDRTIQSARCLLAGLFLKSSLDRPDGFQIPVLSTEDEVLYPNTHMCEALRHSAAAAMEFFDDIPGIKRDRRKIEKALCYDLHNPAQYINFVQLRDDLVARQAHGFEVPEKLRKYMPMIHRNATRILFFAFCGMHERERRLIIKLGVGPALKMATSRMKKIVKGGKTPKICLYSAHDSTMLPLLVALGIFDWRWPPFAADLRLELYEDKQGAYWVRTLYLGEEKKIRGCEAGLCPFDDFITGLKPYLIKRGKTYDKLCKSAFLKEIAKETVKVHGKEALSEEIQEHAYIPPGMN